MNLRRYQTGDCIELYLDAELKSGDGISWFADITAQGDCWMLENSISRHHAGGQDALERFPDVCAAPEEMTQRMERAIENARKLETYATPSPLPKLAASTA